MATDSETLPAEIDEAALFDQAVEDVPAETPEVQPTEGEQAAPEQTQARDEQGRFAAPKDEKEAASDKDADADHGSVPSWRLRESNEERRAALARAEAAERSVSDMKSRLDALERQPQQRQTPQQEQPKAERPDPLIDPEGYDRWIMGRIEANRNEDRLNLSMSLAHHKHGEVFEKAYAALVEQGRAGNRQLVQQITSQPNSGEALVKWHREQETLREVGSDPNAFFDKRLEAYLKDPANLAKVMERAKGAAQQASVNGQRPNVQLPPSLSSMSRAGTGVDTSGGSGDSELFDQLTSR